MVASDRTNSTTVPRTSWYQVLLGVLLFPSSVFKKISIFVFLFPSLVVKKVSIFDKEKKSYYQVLLLKTTS